MNADVGVGYSGAAPTEKQVRAAGRSYVPGTSRGCMVFHGAPDDARHPLTRPYGTGDPGTGLMQALADRGIPCLSADWGGINTWGNDASIARAGDGFTYLTTTAAGFAQAKSDKVVGAGFSMGAEVLLNWAVRNLSKVAALALGIPATNMDEMHDRGVSAAAMETAYGGSVGYEAALATHDPINFAASLAGIPIKIWYGNPDTDAVINPTAVEAFAAAVGSSCQLRSMGSIAHNANLIPTVEMADFLAQYA